MAAPSNPLETFIWGAGGQKMSPEQVARQREIAAALMQGGMDYSPVDHWLQGAARASQGLVGGLKDRWAGEAEQRGREGFQSQWDSVFGGSHQVASVDPVASALTATDAVNSLASVPSGDRAGYIRSGLIQRGLPEHVADAFLMNFQDESGLNPDINEAQPLVPGSRGGYGLYQLTGPRRRAYEAYAAERGVPVSDIDAQLDFMMSELQGPEARAAQAILSAPDTGSAAAAIVNQFLRPSEQHRARREAAYLRGASMPPGNQVSQAGGGNPSVAQLLSLAGNEWANPGQSNVINALLNQQMQQQDPRYQQQLALGDLDMQRAQLELDALRNPAAPAPVFEGGQWWDLSGGAPNALTDRAVDPTAGIQNYDYLIAQGLSPEEAAAMAFSGGVTVNMPGQPNIGSIPAGYSATQDESGGWSMAPIPGGPAAAEAAAAEEQARLRRENIARAGGTVVQDIGRALQILEGDNPLAAGAGALIGQFIPEGDTQTLQGFYNSVLGNVGFDQLQAMREASPTGGALGNVNRTELDFLQGILGRLDVTSRPEVQADNLKRINNIYMDRIHGTPEQIMRAYQSGAINPQTGQPLTLQDIEPLIFRYELSFDEMGRPINRSAPQSQGTIPQSNQTSSGVTWSFVD